MNPGSRTICRPWQILYAPALSTRHSGLAATAALGWQLHREAVALDRQRLERIAKVVLDQLDGRVEKTELMLRQAQDYFGAQSNLTPVLFRDWCRKHALSVNFPWTHGFALYTNRQAGAWRGALPLDPARWTKKEVVDFNTYAVGTPVELEFGFGFCPDANNVWPTNYLWQLQYGTVTNEHGASPYGSIVRNQPKTTGRQSVIRHSKQGLQFGAALVLPVYAPDRDALYEQLVAGRLRVGSSPFNWNLCRGVLVSPMDYVGLETRIWNDQPKEVGVEIFAAKQPSLDSWLNSNASQPRALAPDFQPYLTTTKVWQMYNRSWSLFLYTQPPFEAQSPRRLAWIVGGAGTGLTLLTTALVGVALRAGHRQERMTEQIREARDALAAAQREREKFSRDLHDGTIQSLYAIQLGLGRTVEKVEAEPDNARRELAAVRGELDAVIAEIRQFITAEAGAGKPVDFGAVLRALVQRASAGATAQIEAHCDPGAADRLTGDQAVQLANIAREALSNSLRHAQPRRVELTLRADRESVRLEITDDGVGFDPQARGRTGVGLVSIASRAKEAGGTLEIQSSPGKGTCIAVRVTASPPEPTEPE